MKNKFILLALSIFCYVSFLNTTFATDWIPYTNSYYGFTIEYPANMRAPDVGAKEHLVFWEGAVDKWVILIEDYTLDNFESALYTVGSQFQDRLVKKDVIQFNQIEASKITTTTPSYSFWKSIQIVFVKNNKIFQISNGAIDDSNFERFYGSFKWLEEPTTQSSTQSTEFSSSTITVSSISSESSLSSLSSSSSSSEVAVEPTPVAPQPWYIRFWLWLLSWL